jgi:hypothetical protein
LKIMLDRLALPALPVLPGGRVILRDSIDSDAGDRLRHPIDPGEEEEDGYGSSWRREWDGERYHTREGHSARVRVASREVTDGNCRTPGVVCPSFPGPVVGERHFAMRRKRELEDLIDCWTVNEADPGQPVTRVSARSSTGTSAGARPWSR